MKLFRLIFVALWAVSMVKIAHAQQPQPYPAIPQGVEALRQNASSKTEFTLDHSMLVFASKLDSDNEDLRRVIAGVSGLSVHRYRFQQPWTYDPEAVNFVRQGYHSGGWTQLVNNRDKYGSPGATNLWLRFQNNAISNIAILLARANEVTLIEISGSISPLDLSHLGGHFGIPKIEGGLVIANSGARP